MEGHWRICRALVLGNDHEMLQSWEQPRRKTVVRAIVFSPISLQSLTCIRNPQNDHQQVHDSLTLHTGFWYPDSQVPGLNLVLTQSSAGPSIHNTLKYIYNFNNWSAWWVLTAIFNSKGLRDSDIATQQDSIHTRVKTVDLPIRSSIVQVKHCLLMEPVEVSLTLCCIAETNISPSKFGQTIIINQYNNTTIETPLLNQP